MIFKGVDGYWELPDGSIVTERDSVLSGYLNFCGCGDHRPAFVLIRDHLQNIENWKNGKPLIECDPKIRSLMGYFLDSKGLTDHGTSVDYAWLTEEGKEFLEELNQYLKL